jgi:hypothetical protein
VNGVMIAVKDLEAPLEPRLQPSQRREISLILDRVMERQFVQKEAPDAPELEPEICGRGMHIEPFRGEPTHDVETLPEHRVPIEIKPCRGAEIGMFAPYAPRIVAEQKAKLFRQPGSAFERVSLNVVHGSPSFPAALRLFRA